LETTRSHADTAAGGVSSGVDKEFISQEF